MDIVREEDQRKEFRDILFSLANSQIALKEKGDRSRIYQRLEKLYYAPKKEDCYRHFYSDIFSVLTQIQQGYAPGNIDVLGQNLLEIRKGYQVLNSDDLGNKIDISDSIRKLYDHVSLDIARIHVFAAESRQLLGEADIDDLQAQINNVKSEVIKAQGQQEDVERKLGNSQKEYITILGIFAAVVLAFTGGLAFSTSVLNNIAQVSAYRAVIISLIIGLVLANVLFGLFYYINKLVGREAKIRPLVVSNIVMISLILFTVAAWSFGWIESRNARINNANQSLVTDVKSK